MKLPVRGAAVRRLGLPLPPGRMPMLRKGRPLKRWRYVGVYGAELMLCAADVRVGPFRQRFWAIATPDREIREHTSTFGSAGMEIDGSSVRVGHDGVHASLELEEEPGREVVHPSGEHGWVWTRKQAGVAAHGTVELDGRSYAIESRAVIDDTAGYHERRTTWRWSAGVGLGTGGERLAWNLVSGVNDTAEDSERAIWVDGAEREPAPVEFADLSRIGFAEGGELRFEPWSERSANSNLLLIRSAYRQPFGSFSGQLPGGPDLAEGWGVMEWHDVRW
jgi:Protein of unknown function (DUF2804)